MNIKLFEDFKSSLDIESKLKYYKIENYTINNDGTVDVNGDVVLYNKRLEKIPLKFGKVSGDFKCNANNLKTLENSPYYVGGFFDCSDNFLLQSLNGSPEEVGGGFYCEQTDLRTLKGMPLEIGGDFRISNCINLGYLDSISNIEGYIYCDKDVSTLKFNGYCKGIRKFIDGRWVDKSINKTNESIINKYNIETRLMRFGIDNYTINDDGSVDVNGDVDLNGFNLISIPFSFNYVSGDFYCSNSRLISLKGSPSEVGGSFYCAGNELKNLEGMPLEIGGNFFCKNNLNLKELKSISNIEGDIYCDKHVDISKFDGYCKKIIQR